VSEKSGASSTPASPASVVDRIHDIADARSGSTPRSEARSTRDTVARISSPSRVCRTTYQSSSAVKAAATTMEIWSELMLTPEKSVKFFLGSGPSRGRS